MYYLLSFLFPEPPKILLQSPTEVKLQVGEELRLYVDASCAAGGKLTYQWFRDSSKLNYGVKKEMLIQQVRLEDQGIYTCRVRSEHGGSALTEPTHVIGQSIGEGDVGGRGGRGELGSKVILMGQRSNGVGLLFSFLL